MSEKGVLEWLIIGIKNPRFSRFTRRIVNPLAGTEKVRKFHNPNKAMRTLHRRFLGLLRLFKIPLPFSTAVRPGCKPIKNVWPHRKNRYFYLLDLKDFYPNIKMEHIAPMVCQNVPGLSCEKEKVENFLNRYCFAPEGGLRTGAPASPELANLSAGVLLDSKLAEICERYKLIYTRYLDDLTFSSKRRRIGKRRRQVIRSVILEAGFQINHRKSVVHDLKKSPLIITGIKLEYGGRTMITRSFLRTLRGLIHLAKSGRVDPIKVHGRMGAFHSCVMKGQHFFNRTEEKVLRSYDELKELIRAGAIDDAER